LPRSVWDAQPTRVVSNTERLLELLAEFETVGTFFVLGWVADRYPSLVRAIAGAGHEVGSHSWWHQRVTTLDQAAFRDEVRTSKAILEDITGRPVEGFRAPSFSITKATPWAFDVLLEEGYRYDSSVFPIRRPGYGLPGAPRWPYRIDRPTGSLAEYPLTTLSCLGVRVPAAGGGYLRQLPYGLIRGAFRQAERSGQRGMFYIHPWEIDVDQPRVPVGPITAVRHYRGLDRTMARLRVLLGEFRFTSVRAALEPVG
jgi:polysaccharide deacetylase family protein (PEP-CTERM system associated)